VSPEQAPSPQSRLSIIWSVEARADLRRIDRQTALDILHCMDRYLTTRNGDVKQLKPPQSGYRLRCGDYRLFFEYRSGTAIQVIGVLHRREAYR
jgi:mRNA-degrading endonuclease RelE of RelBE toxin-antitoxin system